MEKIKKAAVFVGCVLGSIVFINAVRSFLPAEINDRINNPLGR